MESGTYTFLQANIDTELLKEQYNHRQNKDIIVDSEVQHCFVSDSSENSGVLPNYTEANEKNGVYKMPLCNITSQVSGFLTLAPCNIVSTRSIFKGDLSKLLHSVNDVENLVANDIIKKNVESGIQANIKDIAKDSGVQNYVHISDRVVPPRAVAVLPSSLQLRRDVIAPRKALSDQTRFGPVEGVAHIISHLETNKLISEAVDTKTPIFLFGKSNEYIMHLDVTDKDKSNWISLLPLGDQSTANVWLYEEQGELYCITTQLVAPRTPLLLGYAKTYAEEYHIPNTQPVLDLHQELSAGSRRWKCHECHKTMTTVTLLQSHIDIYHKEERTGPRRRYRCQNCTLTFSRLSTLKRHTALHCSKKNDKPDATNSSDTITQTDPVHDTTTRSMDETRIPSDESLQNYTNNIDFPTNLFDPDRISSLDIPGNSRCESDFNMYAYADESGVNDDLGFTKLVAVVNGKEIPRKKINKKCSSSKRLSSCPHCRLVMVKGQKKKHLRDCIAQRLRCKCGRVFANKERLSLHLYLEHSMNGAEKGSDTKQLTPYRCETCMLTFKRRGMLVNHMWRAHGASGATVPLRRRDALYPCAGAGCTKLYRTASKRDQHVRAHHPGAVVGRGVRVVGEECERAPAACAACPRQYATRAKMLQHMRQRHPLLAPPKQRKNEKTLNKTQEKTI